MFSSSLTQANQYRDSNRHGVKPVLFQSRAMNAPMQNPVQNSTHSEDYSVWRHTALRYAGYADEVGEFMTPYTGALGKFLGYFVSGLYCAADLGTTLTQKFRNAPAEMTTAQKTRKTAAEGADLSFFHLVATLLIPPKIIGAAVESVNHILDKDALKHALQEAKKAGSSPGWKLQWEKSMNKWISPSVDKFLASKVPGKSTWTDTVESTANGLLKNHGSKLALLVEGTAKLAEQYNRLMPFSYFKDEEMGKKLKANVNFLKNPGSRLNQKQIVKLAWLKPIPVLFGIGLIPLIAHPFDVLMGKIQNWTSRPLLGKNKITRENGQLKSVRNPAFWGKKQPEAEQITASLIRPATFGSQMHSPYHRQTARFGVQNYGFFTQQPTRRSGFPQPSSPFSQSAYPTGIQQRF